MLCIYMGMIYIIDCHFFVFHNEHENIIYVFLKHLCNFQPNNYKKFLVLMPVVRIFYMMNIKFSVVDQ